MGKDYYQILELPYSANKQEIKKAYRLMALHYHPDKNPEPEAHTKFQLIKTAYETLIDEQSKALYDLNLLITKPGTTSKKQFRNADDLVVVTRQILSQLRQIDASSLHQELLFHYMIFLQHRDSSYFLLKNALPETLAQFIKNAIQINLHLHYRYQIPTFLSLIDLAEITTDIELQEECRKLLALAQKQERIRKSIPYLTFAAAAVICVLIYFFGRK